MSATRSWDSQAVLGLILFAGRLQQLIQRLRRKAANCLPKLNQRKPQAPGENIRRNREVDALTEQDKETLACIYRKMNARS